MGRHSLAWLDSPFGANALVNRELILLSPPRSYRLFLLSFAVQHALDQPESGVDLPAYCVLCFESASKMIGEQGH